MPQEISHSEFQELRRRIDELSDKFDDMSTSLTDIKVLLSRQEGIGLPARVKDLEDRLRRAEKWQFLITGGLIVLQLFIAVAGKLIVDKLFG